MSDKPFHIVDYLPETTLEYTTSWASSDGRYSAITLSGPDGFILQTQIDIAGWTKEGLTAFFASMFTQRSGPYRSGGAIVPTDTLSGQDWLIITDVPLDPLNLTVMEAGFPSHASDYMSVKYAQCRIYTETTTSLQMIQSDAFDFGSGSPTASGTLYVTRIVIPDMKVALGGKGVTFPQLRFIAEGVATAEPEFVYLNRLRRSYELQQS